MPKQPKRFQAETLDQAYDQVHDALGDEAVILATRRATAPGLYGRPPRSFVEVLAHLPERSSVPAPVRRTVASVAVSEDLELASPFENPLAGSGHDDGEEVRVDLLASLPASAEAPSATPGQITVEPVAQAADAIAHELAEASATNDMSRPAADEEPLIAPVADDLERAAASQDLEAASATHGRQRSEFEQLIGEIGEMRGIVEQLAVERINDRIDQSPAPLRWLRSRLRDQGLPNALAAKVLDQTADAHVPSANGAALRRTAERQLAMMLPPALHLDLARRNAFIALVGPAGAGKTTFAMKLALEVERAYSLRVVVAGTDVERAGAPQQFSAVGAAAGVQTRLCYTPGELRALISEGIADLVIVDTAGHDGSRRDRMTELQAFIHTARNREVLLALPATMKTVDLERLARAFDQLDLSGVVLTRCDDTITFGEPFSALVSSELPLAFTTHLDSVADAPRPGDNLTLARAITTGDWNDEAVVGRRTA